MQQTGTSPKLHLLPGWLKGPSGVEGLLVDPVVVRGQRAGDRPSPAFLGKAELPGQDA